MSKFIGVKMIEATPIKAEDKIWEGLEFVLQWAKYGLKK